MLRSDLDLDGALARLFVIETVSRALRTTGVPRDHQSSQPIAPHADRPPDSRELLY